RHAAKQKRGAPSLRVRPSDAKLAVPDCVYTEGGHRRKWTRDHPAPPRTSQVCNWPLIIALAPFLESLGYGTGTTRTFSTCPLAHALIPRIGLYHHHSFELAVKRLPTPAAGGILAPTPRSPHPPAPGRRFQNPRRIPRVSSFSSSSLRRTHPSLATATRAASAAAVDARAI
ncbi:hypothetical protein B0H16DRAFT_1575874, partial [Mycena metata]